MAQMALGPAIRTQVVTRPPCEVPGGSVVRSKLTAGEIRVDFIGLCKALAPTQGCSGLGDASWLPLPVALGTYLAFHVPRAAGREAAESEPGHSAE